MEIDPAMQAWYNVISTTNALEISRQKNRKVLAVTSQTTVKDTLQILKDNNILACPVIESGKFVGFVDVLDICGAILAEWKAQSRKLWQPTQRESGWPTMEELLKAPISKLVNFSAWDTVVPVRNDHTVQEIIQFMINQSFSVHRVVVTNAKNEFVNIITQSDLVKFAHDHVEKFPYKDQPVKNLPLIRSCVMVSIDSPVSDALDILYTNRVSGIALVDYEGKLSGNLSASDLRGILPDAFDFFTGSTLQFLCKATSSAPHAPLTCKESTTFSQLLKLITSSRIHRVYVVDDNDRPLGVISLSDILPLLLVGE